jgi:hypothetical protein
LRWNAATNDGAASTPKTSNPSSTSIAVMGKPGPQPRSMTLLRAVVLSPTFALSARRFQTDYFRDPQEILPRLLRIRWIDPPLDGSKPSNCSLRSDGCSASPEHRSASLRISVHLHRNPTVISDSTHSLLRTTCSPCTPSDGKTLVLFVYNCFSQAQCQERLTKPGFSANRGRIASD